MTKRSKLLTARIFGIIFLVAGVIISFVSGLFVFDSYEMISSSDISFKYMDNYEYYNFKELEIVAVYEEYRHLGDFNTEERYCIVAFDDAGGGRYFALMTVEDDKDIFDELGSYLENSTENYKINAVVTYVCPIEDSVWENTVLNAYEKTVQNFGTDDIIDSGVGFDYCGVPENFDYYVQENEKSDIAAFSVGIVFLAAGVFLTVFGFRKGLKEAEQYDAFKNYGPANRTYNYTGAYYYPPINNNYNEQ